MFCYSNANYCYLVQTFEQRDVTYRNIESLKNLAEVHADVSFVIAVPTFCNITFCIVVFIIEEPYI